MATSFNLQTINIGSTDYPTKVTYNFQQLGDNAVHKDDIAGYVAMGGDPSSVGVDELNNGSLNAYDVVTRLPGDAVGAALSTINLRQSLTLARITAFQQSRFR